MLVSWDDCSQYMESHKAMFQPTKQFFWGDRSDGPPPGKNNCSPSGGAASARVKMPGPCHVRGLRLVAVWAKVKQPKKVMEKIHETTDLRENLKKLWSLPPLVQVFLQTNGNEISVARPIELAAMLRERAITEQNLVAMVCHRAFFLVHTVDSCRFPMLNCWKEV